MNEYVSTIAQTCYIELRRLASIRRFQTNTATATLVSASQSKGTATSIIVVVRFGLSITTIFGHRAHITLTVRISKSHDTFTTLFSATGSG